MTELQQHIAAQTSVAQIERVLRQAGYHITGVDSQRPWGGFVCIDPAQAGQFAVDFFAASEVIVKDNAHAPLSPKILFVRPGARLSWQYHHRRAELWRFLTAGAYYCSMSDELPPQPTLAQAGDIVRLAAGERHRACGDAQHPTIIAELWQHIDPTHPSTEDDIVRVADDYQRR